MATADLVRRVPAGVNLDALGEWWIIWTVLWTAILIGGMSFLWSRRNMPILRIRGLPLSFGAIALLHGYWCAVNLGYVYGALMPEVAEYWIMGIWLPFGIALFHASNSRFLYVANAQKRFVRRDSIDEKAFMYRAPERKTLRQKWRAMDYSNKVLITVCVGMALHLTLTVIMFLVSRKFHDSWGIDGTEVTGTPAERKQQQGRGWEWWPSVFWQIFWAWIIAPYILWQSRGVKDTQGWRVQTIGCCVAGLHAAPMWLIALYVPGMAPVNKYWIPPQWLAVSIMFLEIFTVFIPCWEVLKQQSLSAETLESIQRWEDRQRNNGDSGKKSVLSGSTLSSGSSWMPRTGRAISTHSSSNGSILTMDALEHTLARNPEPLQHFSALRDFSGENIAFLMAIKEWKKKYFPVNGINGVQLTKEAATRATCRESFEAALRIYIDFVSARCAEFQVNLSSTDFKRLESVFEPVAKILYADKKAANPATPFADIPLSQNGSQVGINEGSGLPSVTDVDSTDGENLVNVNYWGDLPEAFDEKVWDDAESSIKYLVLTNTWPKFIKERKSFDTLSTARMSHAETAV